jgi:hypothetical protein
MSRIEELKKQNPQFSLNYVDIINELFDKPIYTEMVINLLKNQFNVDKRLRGTAIRRELVNEFKIDDKIVDLSTKVVVELFKTLWQRKGFWESALKSVR